MKPVLLALALLVGFFSIAASQTPVLAPHINSRSNPATNIYLLQANRPPTTIWFKMDLYNRQYDWNRMRVVGAFATKRLQQPLNIPGVGAIELDPNTLLHFDPAMSTRFVTMKTSTHAEILAWTVMPTLPGSLIGTRFYGQFVAYESNSSNPRWVASIAFPSSLGHYSWVVLPG